MKIPQLIQRTISSPALAASSYRKLIHAFDFFNLDYRLASGYSFPPKSVCLILTEKCNLKCAMCDIGRLNTDPGQGKTSPLVKSIRNGEEDMSIDDWRTLVHDLSRFFPKPLILLTGTEPFMSPEILKIIKTIVAERLSLHITTNGTLLTRYARKLVELCQSPSGVDMTVSLDDIGDAHDRIRGVPGTFSRAIEGIRAVVSARKETKKLFPLINITCTISSYNYKRLEPFADWFMEQKIPIESITFNHLWFKDAAHVTRQSQLFGEQASVAEVNAGGVDRSAIDMSAVCRQLQNIKKKYAATSLRIHQEPELSPQDALLYYREPCRFIFYDRCTAAWRNISITPRGNIILSPLCFLPALGNIKRKSFRSLWNSEPLREVRRQLKKARAYPVCSRCCMLFGSKPKFYKIKSWLS
jgi:Fe-coproporphyrin III synthase